MPKTLRRQSRKNNFQRTCASCVLANAVFDRPSDMKADNDTEPTAVRLEG
jgi:hypothetical protein